MRLYYLPGASSLFPHIVLVESGLLFHAVEVDKPTKTVAGGGDYLTVNPMGYVPALQLEDGAVLTEGTAIAQYVADRVPGKCLVPTNGTFARAKLQSWLNFIAAEMHAGCFCPLFNPEIPPALKTIFHHRLTIRLAHVERHLCQNRHLLATGFSIADVYLFVVTNWSRLVALDLAPYPAVMGLRKRVGTRAATREAMRRETSSRRT